MFSFRSAIGTLIAVSLLLAVALVRMRSPLPAQLVTGNPTCNASGEPRCASGSPACANENSLVSCATGSPVCVNNQLVPTGGTPLCCLHMMCPQPPKNCTLIMEYGSDGCARCPRCVLASDGNVGPSICEVQGSSAASSRSASSGSGGSGSSQSASGGSSSRSGSSRSTSSGSGGSGSSQSASGGSSSRSGSSRSGSGGSTGICGNGRREAGEECDDGNNRPDDGCDPQCRREPGWDCRDVPIVESSASSQASSVQQQSSTGGGNSSSVASSTGGGNSSSVASSGGGSSVTGPFCGDGICQNTPGYSEGIFVCDPLPDGSGCEHYHVCLQDCLPGSASESSHSAPGSSSGTTGGTNGGGPQCLDSDEADVTHAGTVIEWGTVSTTDSCRPGGGAALDYVNEEVCRFEGRVRDVLECPAGSRCNAGACTPVPGWQPPVTPNCTETDGGFNPLIKGTATDPSYSDTDICAGDYRLQETYCSGGLWTSPSLNRVTKVIVPCPGGMKCTDGACRQLAFFERTRVLSFIGRFFSWLRTGPTLTAQVGGGSSAGGVITVCDPICGDRLIVDGEECDDGNTQPNDGCSPTCRREGSASSASNASGSGGSDSSRSGSGGSGSSRSGSGGSGSSRSGSGGSGSSRSGSGGSDSSRSGSGGSSSRSGSSRSGSGGSSSRSGSSRSGSSGSTHAECSGNRCVSVPGAGENGCNNDAECIVSHAECRSNLCMEVAGAGNNLCSPSVSGDCLPGSSASSHSNSSGSGGSDSSRSGSGGSDSSRSGSGGSDSSRSGSGGSDSSRSGSGGSSSRSGSSRSGSSGSTHAECSGNRCISVPGAGANVCNNDADCTDSHAACRTNLCMEVAGAGNNECSPSVNGDCVPASSTSSRSASSGSPASGSSRSSASSRSNSSVASGSSSRSNSSASGGNSSSRRSADSSTSAAFHFECLSQRCLRLPGLGLDACNADSQCVNSHAACRSNQCMQIPGSGPNECQTSAQCAPFHTECSNRLCISVLGPGSDQCMTNSNCNPVGSSARSNAGSAGTTGGTGGTGNQGGSSSVVLVQRLRETCGDAIVTPPEACDDGNRNDTDSCTNLCLWPSGHPCTSSLQCADGLCIDGVCRACQTDTQCAAGRICIAGVCSACGDGIVTPPESCDDTNRTDADSCTNRCAFGNGQSCTSPFQCQSHVCLNGVCVPCAGDAACPVSERCLNGQCVAVRACERDADCGANAYCVGGRCQQCRSQNDCNAGYACETGRCVRSSRCSVDRDCAPGDRCVDGRCVTCMRDADCPEGKVCRSGQCSDRAAAPVRSRAELLTIPFSGILPGQAPVHAPTGQTGPAALAVMAAGAALGGAWVRRRRRGP